MIINTGQRTDIPAFYSDWLLNRIREGYVCVRNPYYPEQVTRYRLTPDVVDVLVFCTKNPRPLLDRIEQLDAFRQFWFVTITPYGRDIEPNVPPWETVAETFRELSDYVGSNATSWRYDPILLTEDYDVRFHVRTFEEMAKRLRGSTNQVVISFIDLYRKTKRNFSEAKSVPQKERCELGRAFAQIAGENGMIVRSCAEGDELAVYGVDTAGCITQQILEDAIGVELDLPKAPNIRPACNCVMGHDIGAYNTCGHFCKYCYANDDRQAVIERRKRHDPESPFLVGGYERGDRITEAKQRAYTDGQLRLVL